MYNPNFSTFDALKSNGQFNLVDKEIRKDLAIYLCGCLI